MQSSNSIVVFSFLFLLAIFATCQESSSFENERLDMVKRQLENRGISDPRVLCAMRKVPRHLFVPERYRSLSYHDHPLPIGADQTISQPYIVALMTTMAHLDTGDHVLEIGTGSGYQAAILAEICDSVYTVEIRETLSQNAQKTLKNLGYHNIRFKTGDGFLGWTEFAPYDAIIVTCAPGEIPNAYVEQLTAGGRLVIPVGPATKQELVLYKKKSSELRAIEKIPVRFVPMVNKSGKSY